MLSCQVRKTLRDFELQLSISLKDETLVIIGHSGCGKSTTLKLLSGLLDADEGEVRLNDRVLFETTKRVNLPPEKRKTGFMFQNYALFPHLSVRENIGFGFARKMEKKERAHRLQEVVGMLRIPHLLDSMPAELSGGEQQRVALARALVLNPQLLLLDEPLSALDVTTRGHVRKELRRILSQLNIPSIVVTHDYEDAIILGDRIMVMEKGHVIQEGKAEELLLQPRSSFVADFSGSNYFLSHAVPLQAPVSAAVGATGDEQSTGQGTRLQVAPGVELFSLEKGEGKVAAVIYPWEIQLSDQEFSVEADFNVLRCQVNHLYSYGNRVRVEMMGEIPLSVELTPQEAAGLSAGKTVYACIAPEHVHVIEEVYETS